MLSLKPKNNPGEDSYRSLLLSYKKEIEKKDKLIQELKKQDNVSIKKCATISLHKHYKNQYGWDFCPRCGFNLGELKNEM